ncbi:MAG: glycosyltransferase family 4 protein [Proteobacteria bacterium]|nr:glycosyltransferase family 4 protein [Pseudomonadota bacterium]
MKRYDYLFVTHLPAFYKVNLYNQLAKHCALFVIFIADGSTIRTKDFTQEQFEFSYCILNKGMLEKRTRWKSLIKLSHCLKNIHFRKLVVGGWDLPEFWYLIMAHQKTRNCLALESSIYESVIDGWRYWIKRLFLSRVGFVFSSGQAHKALLDALRYAGVIKTTLGVGQFNYHIKNDKPKSFSGKFLYVGRFAPEKNLIFLLQVFAKLPQYTLTLIGMGPEQAALEKIKTNNVTIKGHIPNELLSEAYLTHDVFILPSLREPWGLVVEEALFHGLPVVASNQVGCAKDLVENTHAGVLFVPTDERSLQNALTFAQNHFEDLKDNAAVIDFKVRDEKQIQQYIEVLL